MICKRPPTGHFVLVGADGLDVADDVRENVADGRPQERQDDDHNDSDQNKDQRVFNEPLASFFRCVQHGILLQDDRMKRRTTIEKQ